MTDARQIAYADYRREYREAFPPVRVIDGPPALVLTPPPGPCERCAGTGTVRLEASDMVLQITCPTCGGSG